MELAQNIFALPGQGMPNASASVASRAVPVSAESTALPSGSTPDGTTQDGGTGNAEFGNLLNIILGLAPPSDGTENKISPSIGAQNESVSQTAPAIANVFSAIVSPEAVLPNNGITVPKNQMPVKVQSSPAEPQKKSNIIAHDTVQDAQTAILLANTYTPGVPEIAVAAIKFSETNSETVENSVSAPAFIHASTQNIFLGASINNSLPALVNQGDLEHTQAASEVTPLTDKLLNSTAIIATPGTKTDSTNTVILAQASSQTYLPFAMPKGDEQQNAKEQVSTNQTPSGIIVSDIPSASPEDRHPSNTASNQTNPALISAPALLAAKTSDQTLEPKKKIEAGAVISDTAPPAPLLDYEIPDSTNAASESPPDQQGQDFILKAPLENANIQPAVNPAASVLAPQILLTGQLALPSDMKPATENGITAEAQQTHPQGKTPIRPLLDQNTDRGAAPPAIPAAPASAQTQNAPASQQTLVDGQSFAQTLAQNSESIMASTPDGSPQSANTEMPQGETGNIILLDKQEPLRAGATPTMPRTETQPHHVSPPIRDIAVHISQHADTGINRFQLRLDPPELGRVDVRMEISAEGKLSAVIAVERPETLDLLQRDSRALERSLMEAGLKTDSNSLSFSLKGGRQDNQHSDASNPGSDKTANSLLDDWDDSVAPMTTRFANRAVNIRI